MKRIKQLLAMLLCVCVLGTMCVLSAAALSTTANREVKLTIGVTTLTLTDEAVISVMEFIPGEAGMYKISLEGATLYRVYGSMGAGYFYHQEVVAGNVLEIEIKESLKNSPMLLGAAGNGTATLTIERQGEASFDVNALPYETYQHTEKLTKFDLPDDIVLAYVDVTVPHTAVKGGDGYYHLDRADGPILYFDFVGSPYVPISAAAANGAMKDVLYDENGNFLKKEEYITCINTYYGYTDNATNRPVAGYTDKGIYPLTDDLVYIMQTHTTNCGWNDISSANYLFADETVDADTAWMFPVCYDAAYASDAHVHSWEGTTCAEPLTCTCGALHPEEMGPHAYDESKVCTVCGNDDPAAKLIIGNVSGYAGEQVEVTFTMENLPALKALALSNITYDKKKLELVSGRWSDLGGLLADFDTTKLAAVIAFPENTDVNTVVFTLTFRIKDGVGGCSLPVTCNVVAKTVNESGVEVSAPLLIKAGSVKAMLRGDMNDDGVITTDDAVYLLYHTSLPDEYPVNQPADMNGDGEVGSEDAICLLYYFLLPDLYPLV